MAPLVIETWGSDLEIGLYVEAALGEHDGQFWLYVIYPSYRPFEIEGNLGHHGHLGDGSGSSWQIL